MIKFIARFTAIMLLMVGVVATATVQAQAMAKPHGSTQLILARDCHIDYENSVYWTGNVEDSVLQIVWLVKQLPERCLKYKCVFTNIDQFSFMRLTTTRWLEKWKNHPQLWNMGVLVTETMKDCRIEQNPPPSIAGSGGGIDCGNASNTSTINISGSGNRVQVGQQGCNYADIEVIGDNVIVILRQVGQNTAVARIHGSNISFTLNQSGQSYYNSTVTSGNHNIVQNGN